MLNEIIEAIGYDNILATVNNSIDMKNSLYIQIPKDRTLQEEDFLLIDKEVEVNQLEKSKWFKVREGLSSYITPNKAVVKGNKKYPKVIFSVHKNAIMFKWDKFIQHKNTTDDIDASLNLLFNEYLDVLQAEDYYFEYYHVNIKKIIEYINKNQLTKVIVKIFLDADIEDYKQQYADYLKNNLIDEGTQIKINNRVYGRVSQFYTLNDKKPLLSHMLKNTSEIHLLDEMDVLKIFYLKQYLDSLKYGKVKWGIGSISFNETFNSSTKKWDLDDFQNNPYRIIDDLTKDIYIRNILNSKYIKETTIKTYNDLSKYILNELLDFKVKNSYNDKDKTENKFKTFSLMYYKYIANLNNANFDIFQRVYTNMMRNMLKLYIDDEDINKIQQIINFNICMSDYLFKTNIKGDLIEMINRIKDKILNMDNEYVIENDFEFYILCGQMAKYLKSKTHTDNITNKLFYEYNMAIKTRQLMDILQRDKGRLDYESNNNSRSGKILYAINNYYTLNEKRLKKIDKIRFNMGLYYGENIFYISNKNNENKKGE